MMDILNLGNCSTHWQPIITEKRCIHSRLNSSLMRWKKSSRTFPKSSVANGAADSSQTPSKDKNVQLFHSEAVENLVKPSSEKPAEQIKSNSDPLTQLRHGGFLENRLLYRQKFVIRSYEVGADKATSITTIFNFFQDVSLCHVHLMGISGDGFGATKAMNRHGLIWVVAKMHAEVEEFPKWPNVIEIDSWIARAGKNRMRRDWIVRHCDTNEVLVRATRALRKLLKNLEFVVNINSETFEMILNDEFQHAFGMRSTWCMMDSTTRRLAKIPDAAQAELSPFFWDDRFVFQQRGLLSNRIIKLDHLSAQHVSPPLKSCWADLDVNQHVTNSKYISWTLQSVPEEHVETHHLTSISLEYRRECQSKTIVESLTSSKTMMGQEDQDVAAGAPAEDCWTFFAAKPAGHNSCQFTHLLQTQGSEQQEIARARTTWRPKSVEERE